MTNFRTEKDSLGEVRVPEDALWGAQTQRAIENFPVSGQPMPPAFIAAVDIQSAGCWVVYPDVSLAVDSMMVTGSVVAQERTYTDPVESGVCVKAIQVTSSS